MHDEYELANKFNWKEWKRILRFVKPYKKIITMLLTASIILAFFNALFPMLSRYAINTFVKDQTSEGLGVFIGLFLIVALIQGGFNVLWGILAMKIDLGIGKDMRYELFRHTQTLSVEYFNKTPVGFILARISNDTNSMGATFSWMLGSIVDCIAYIVFALINMFLLSPKLASIMLLVIAVLVVITGYYQNILIGLNRITRKQNSVITASYNENITGAQTIKSMGAEDVIISEFDHINQDMREKTLRVKKVQRSYIPLISLVGGLSIAMMVATAVPMVSQNLLDVGTLAVFITYSFALIPTIEELTHILNDAVSLQANVERVNSLIDTAPTIFDDEEIVQKYGDIYNPKTENWEELKGDIEFKDVSFHYPDSDTYVLEKFNLTIKAGTCVAIVGQTGAGKSTLVNLICRFFEPTKGTILIDGKDYKKRSLLWLENNLSYVLQSPHLFSGTIAQNIKYKNPLASDEEMITASKQAQSHSFIEKLPKGYDTEIGQEGGKLSTGQKQLVSIARALMANGKILVMDEATSSVDTKTEQLINSITGTIREGKTSFIIAHRLSTVKNADVIIVVDNGKIIEMGNHQTLLKQEGHYYNMYTSQWEDEEQEKLFDTVTKKV